MARTTLTASSGAPVAPDADFETTLTLQASPDSVFDALTTTTGLSGWWTRVTGSGLAGGELTFTFDVPLTISVDQAERPGRVRWTAVGFEPLPDWAGTTINFDVTPIAGGGSQLQFRHTGLTPHLECFDECSSGWTHYLASLVAYVESGHGHPFEPASA